MKIGQWRWTGDVRKDRGAGMCNTTESAWAMWAKLSVGWLLWEEGWCLCCSEGTCHLRCLQLLRTLVTLQEPILVLMTPARPRLTLDYQAVAALPCIWLCLRAHPSPRWSGCVGTGTGFDWLFPALLLWSCHRERSCCHHSGSLEKPVCSGLGEACAQQFEHPRSSCNSFDLNIPNNQDTRCNLG